MKVLRQTLSYCLKGWSLPELHVEKKAWKTGDRMMVMQKRMVFLKIGVWLTAVFLLMSASSKAAAGEQSIVDILNANSGNGTGGQSGVPASAAAGRRDPGKRRAGSPVRAGQ